MTRRAKLLDAVRNNPRDVRFADLVRLVESLGFALARQSGSHAVYQHPLYPLEVIDIIDRCQLEVK